MNPSGKIALVTGAASGIGKETALALAQAGAKLIICDVNEEALRAIEQELNGISECLLAEIVDVSDRTAMERFAANVHDAVPAVDILVANAGVGLAGGFLGTTMDDWEWIIGINLMGVIHTAHYFVPKMVERGQGGHVVNVSSMLGYWISPEVIGYTTAKHGVFGFSECLREDLRSHNIGVSTICPGLVTTNIIQTSRIVGKDNPDQMRSKVDQSYVKRNYTPDKVAKGIMKAIRGGKTIVPVSPESWLMYYLNRVYVPLSRYLARKTAADLQK